MAPAPSVSIARATPADAAELIAGHLASRDFHAPWAAPFTDQAGFEAWYGRMLTGPAIGLVVRDGADGAVAGVITASEIVWGAFRSAYLGWHAMADKAGRGLMTAGLEAACDLLLGEVGLHRLEANIQPGNAASLALAARCHFGREGFSPRYLRIDGDWRDHERWARLADG